MHPELLHGILLCLCAYNNIEILLLQCIIKIKKLINDDRFQSQKSFSNHFNLFLLFSFIIIIHFLFNLKVNFFINIVI